MNINIKNGDTSALRTAITGNAIFSALSGLIIVAFEPAVLSWLGLQQVAIYPVGLMLIGFALYLTWMANCSRVPVMLVQGVIAGDWIWVIVSVFLIVFKATAFSGFGVFLILDIAVVVMTFALLQGRALRQARIHLAS